MRNHQIFLTVAILFYFPTSSVQQGFQFLYLLADSSYFSFLKIKTFFIIIWMDVKSPCGSDLPFPNDCWCCASFVCLLAFCTFLWRNVYSKFFFFFCLLLSFNALYLLKKWDHLSYRIFHVLDFCLSYPSRMIFKN